MTRAPNWTGIASGAVAAGIVLCLMPAMARHIGGGACFTPGLFWLVVAGAALGGLLARLLQWAAPSGVTPGQAAQPWLAVFILPLAFVLPPGRMEMTGSALGPVKHVYSAAWMLGIALFGAALLPPVLREFVPRRVAAACFALVLLVSLCLSVQPPNESDEGDYVAAALALVTTGTTRVDQAQENGAINQYYFDRLPSSWGYFIWILEHQGAPPYRYSLRMFGYPLMLAPFVGISLLVTTPALRWFISYLPGLAGYAVCVWSMAWTLERFGEERRWTMAMLATAIPLIFFPSNTQPEIWLAAGPSLVFYLTLTHRGDTRGELLAAAAAGCLPLFHERMAVFTLVFWIYLWIASPRRWRLSACCALFLIPTFFSFAAVNQFQMMRRLPHAYGRVAFFDPQRWLRALVAHCFSMKIGLFVRYPTALLAVAGVLLPPRRWSSPEKLAAALFLPYFLMIITYPDSFDSWPHLRYLVPLFPVFLPFLDRGAAWVNARAGGPALLRSLYLIQLAIAWPFLAVPHLWRDFI